MSAVHFFRRVTISLILLSPLGLIGAGPEKKVEYAVLVWSMRHSSLQLSYGGKTLQASSVRDFAEQARTKGLMSSHCAAPESVRDLVVAFRQSGWQVLTSQRSSTGGYGTAQMRRVSEAEGLSATRRDLILADDTVGVSG